MNPQEIHAREVRVMEAIIAEPMTAADLQSRLKIKRSDVTKCLQVLSWLGFIAAAPMVKKGPTKWTLAWLLPPYKGSTGNIGVPV